MSSFFGVVVMLANFALSPALLLLLAFFGFNKDGLLGGLLGLPFGSEDPGSCCADPLDDALLCISKFVAVKSESLAFFLMVSSFLHAARAAAVSATLLGISLSSPKEGGTTNCPTRVVVVISMSFFSSFLFFASSSSVFSDDPFVPVFVVVIVSSSIAFDDDPKSMMMMMVVTSGVGVDDEMTFRVLSFFLCAGETMPIDPKKNHSLSILFSDGPSLSVPDALCEAAVVCLLLLLLLRDAPPPARAPFCAVV